MHEKDANFDFDQHQLMLYVEKDDGTYGTVQTGSFMGANYMDDFWGKMQTFERQAMEQLSKGEISPVAYYIILREMTPPDVASRTGLRTGTVKKHMTMRGFEKMSVGDAAKYAEVFGVPVANLFQLVVKQGPAPTVAQAKTGNQYVVIAQPAAPRTSKDSK